MGPVYPDCTSVLEFGQGGWWLDGWAIVVGVGLVVTYPAEKKTFWQTSSVVMNSTFRAVVFSFFFFNNVCKFLPTVLRTLFPTCLRIQRLYQQMCFTHSTCCVLPAGFSLFSFVDTAAFTLYTHLANLSNTSFFVSFSQQSFAFSGNASQHV